MTCKFGFICNVIYSYFAKERTRNLKRKKDLDKSINIAHSQDAFKTTLTVYTSITVFSQILS